MDVVRALALQRALGEVERIGRMAAGAEARRIAVLRELERRRAASAEGERRGSGRARDAEFTGVHRGGRPGR